MFETAGIPRQQIPRQRPIERNTMMNGKTVLGIMDGICKQALKRHGGKPGVKRLPGLGGAWNGDRVHAGLRHGVKTVCTIPGRVSAGRRMARSVEPVHLTARIRDNDKTVSANSGHRRFHNGQCR